MRAVRWHGAKDVRVEDIADPGEPPADWVRLRVEACGLCGTDVEEYLHGPVIIRNAPLVLGHEIAGVVEAAGAGTTLGVGQRVAVEGNIPCRSCAWCRRGEWNLCPANVQLGLQVDGGLATHVLAPAAACVPVEADVPPEHAALAEPISVAVRAVTRARVRNGDSVAVVGAGTVGLLLAQVARVAGASSVTVVEPHPGRRELALRLGADAAVDPGEGDADSGEHDVAFESAGSAAAALAAVAATRRGGRTVLLGVADETLKLSMLDLLLGEKTLLTSLSHVVDPDFTTAVDYINRGLLDLDPIITDRISLADAVSGGLDVLVADAAAHLKVTVLPT